MNSPMTVATDSLTVFDDDGKEVERQKTTTSQLSPDVVKMNRLKMTLFHFIISYPKWSLSIFLFLASLSTPLLPSWSDATSIPYEHLQVFVREESKAYYECTVDAFDHLQAEMIEVANREYEEVLKRRSFNQALLADAGQTTNACAAAALKAQEAIYGWVTENQSLPFINSSSTHGICTNQDRKYIGTMVEKDFVEIEKEINSVVGGYVDSSQSSLSHVTEYAEERIEYDYNYFLRDRIHPVLDLLKNVELSGIEPIEFAVNAGKLVETLLAKLKSIRVTVTTIEARMDILNKRLQEFFGSLLAFLDGYEDLRLRLLEGRSWALGIVPEVDRWKIPDALLTAVDIPSGIALLPPVFEIPTFDSDLLDIDIILDDFAKETLRLIEELIEALEEQATKAVEAAVKALITKIRDMLTLDDYDPPQYKGSQPDILSLEAEIAHLYKLGAAAEAKTLDALEKARYVRNNSVGEVPSDLPDIDTSNHTFSGNITTFSYERPRLPSFTIPELIEALLSIVVTYQWIFEMIVQALRLWRLKYKYERDANPDLPEIDFGTADIDDEDSSEEDRLSGCLKIAFTLVRTLFSPWTILFLFALPFAILGISTWYPHVQAGCVKSKNGTYLANHIISPLMINRASSPGNELYSRSELECGQKQRILCEHMSTDSEGVHRNDLISLSIIMQRYKQSNALISRLERCINVTKLDSHFEEACCGLEGYSTGCAEPLRLRDYRCPIDERDHPPSAFRPLSLYLKNSSCISSDLVWSLKDSRFDCKALEDSCSKTPCSGVNEKLIQAMVIEADCTAELYTMRIFSFMFMVLYHAVMINLIVTLLFNGIKNLSWRKLNPNGIKLKTQVNEQGDLVKGAHREDRSSHVLAAVRRFEFQGWFQLIFGVVCFLFWFLSCLLSPKLFSE